jgi:hypothetical protein
MLEVFSLRNLSILARKIIIITVSALFIAQVTSGCSGNESSKQDVQLQAVREKQSQESESEGLKKTEAQIEKLFETLGGPHMKIEGDKDDNNAEQQEKTADEGQKQDQQQSGSQKDSQKQSQQNSDQKDNTGQQDKQQGQGEKGGQEDGRKQDTAQGGKQTEQQAPDKWSQVGSIINKLHYQWNDLMPEITKKGADMKLVDNFANALNTLTIMAESRDKEKVLSCTNKLYSYIPDLYSLYRTKMSPEVKRMIYYTRNIILESDKNSWEQVGKDNEALGKSWSILRNSLEKEKKEIEDKLDLSIYELKKVVEEKNSQLCGIKGRIVLNNIQLIQKSFEEDK